MSKFQQNSDLAIENPEELLPNWETIVLDSKGIILECSNFQVLGYSSPGVPLAEVLPWTGDSVHQLQLFLLEQREQTTPFVFSLVQKKQDSLDDNSRVADGFEFRVRRARFKSPGREGVSGFEGVFRQIFKSEFLSLYNAVESPDRAIHLEDELAAVNDLFLKIIDAIPTRVFWKDKNLNYIGCNQAFARDQGLSSPTEALGCQDADLAWGKEEAFLKQLRADDQEVIQSGNLEMQKELHVQFQPRKNRKLRISRIPLYNRHGRIYGVLCTYDDISKEMDMLRQLQVSEEKFQQLVENIPEIFWLFDARSMEVLYVSKAFEDIFRRTSDEVMYTNIFTPIHILKSDLHRVEAAFDQILENRVDSITLEFRIRMPRSPEEVSDSKGQRKVGPARKIRWIRTIAVPVKDEEGRIIRIAAISSDVTGTKEQLQRDQFQEEQLRQAEKMASLGILVSGVAHEINNPNNLIMLNSDFLSTVWKDVIPILDEVQSLRREQGQSITLGNLPYDELREEFSRLLFGIGQGAERIRSIVRSLKEFIRMDNGSLDNEVDLNHVVEDALLIVGNIVKKSTSCFKLELDTKVKPVRGNAQQLEQVLINLITNSCQALEDKSKALLISTKADSNGVEILVQDEGKGIPEEHLDKIMDPFFTTKQEQGGTGLGLSVSYGIVQAHQGSLIFNSQQGKGTTAVLKIPVISE